VRLESHSKPTKLTKGRQQFGTMQHNAVTAVGRAIDNHDFEAGQYRSLIAARVRLGFIRCSARVDSARGKSHHQLDRAPA